MSNIGLEARLSGPVVRGVTTREKYLDYVDELKAGSLDFYATMRSLYRQRRQKEISGNLEDDKMSLNDIPTDVYEEPDLANEIKTIVQEEFITDTVVENTSNSKRRVYNGIMPSSLYPDFSESRVNLIN